MPLPPFTPIGRIVKTHGSRGEVAVAPARDLPFVFPEGLEVWLAPPPDGPRRVALLASRQGPKGPLVTLSGVDDMGTARRLVGTTMLVRTEDLPEEWTAPPPPDAVGLSVSDAEHGELGTVERVIVTGANDVWVVAGPLGEILLPVIDDVVRDVDWTARRAAVVLLPGLLPNE